nr:MAG TPA: hypothetical protein [Caudoviricetes sp.]
MLPTTKRLKSVVLFCILSIQIISHSILLCKLKGV